MIPLVVKCHSRRRPQLQGQTHGVSDRGVSAADGFRAQALRRRSGRRGAGVAHCLYVPVETAADPDRLRTHWFGDRMTQWQLEVMTQAELTSTGVAFFGPWPPPAIKPVSTTDVQAAVHQEISGYWRRIARQRRCCRQDTWV
jgi:hypothetical protein